MWFNRTVRSSRRAWLVGTAGVLALGLIGYVGAAVRYCDAFWNITRGSLLFRLCSMSSEPIASLPVVAPIGRPTYSRRLADGMKPSLHFLKYSSARPAAEVQTTLATFLTSRGFALARRESVHEWWTDHRSEMGLQVRATGERTCEVEVVHDTGSE
jgi:hypothetical protein